MTTNATVEAQHRTEATAMWKGPGIEAVAQALANLEAANKRLADIDRIAAENCWAGLSPEHDAVAALASGHTPSPCPSCAAKDEAMEAFRREVSVACYVVVKGAGEHYAADANTVSTHLSRFIIPPADPLAEALKALDALVLFHKSGGYEGAGENADLARCEAALAELKSRLGGAK